MRTNVAQARILVIDDDGPMNRMIAMTLRSNGYEVTTAQNGLLGLEQVEADRPHVIVLDLNMPVMDGRTFYRELRARGIDTPVIILSAHGAREAQRELNANAYITKPFFPDDLANKVEQLLEQ